MAGFRKEIEVLDWRFLECLSDQQIYSPDNYSWWRVYVPLRDGKGFAEGLESLGFQVEVVPVYRRK
ncbi:hypothetical protein SAMN05421805_1337 [Saccharopolyspora antimicrobica]|uniref:Uncharacterized protein n=1 Tax=Saccharopolyspora antimicrobica TaxID=455193 RepID=A0A1I5LSC8_9PSEU|nr:hypothetical protein ATL45_5737 [Saccharopolyspora antimicrobica]SFP00249.1 hypothetical protein SAMN05421805_1337 [Saccharopolyspora antimicrobica]